MTSHLCLLFYTFSHVNLKFLSSIVSIMGVALACTKGENTLRGPKIVITLYIFSRVPCLKFNHVIIMKDFHNIFAYYGRSKPKEAKWHKHYIFLFHVM